MKKLYVKLSTGTQFKEFIDEDVCWTNDEGYLRIRYGKDLIAEFSPDSWNWVELIPSEHTEYRL